MIAMPPMVSIVSILRPRSSDGLGVIEQPRARLRRLGLTYKKVRFALPLVLAVPKSYCTPCRSFVSVTPPTPGVQEPCPLCGVIMKVRPFFFNGCRNGDEDTSDDHPLGIFYEFM